MQETRRDDDQIVHVHRTRRTASGQGRMPMAGRRQVHLGYGELHAVVAIRYVT